MIRRYALLAALAAGLFVAGCGSGRTSDSEPPPGVRRNEAAHPAGAKKAKPTQLRLKKPA